VALAEKTAGRVTCTE